MHIDRVEVGTTSKIRRRDGTPYKNPKRGYYLEVKRYPTLRHFLWARLYHWYDMRIPSRLPGWKRFCQWLRKHGAEHRHGGWWQQDDGSWVKEPEARWRDRLYGWTVSQDLRCFHLNDRPTCATMAFVKVDEETYRGLSRIKQASVAQGKERLSPKE